MKRFFAFLIACSVICSAAVSESFFAKKRFLEIKAGTDFGFSNNTLSAADYMKKDLVIDLRKMADECPQDGFDIITSLHPEASMNINIKSLNIGFSTGAEFYEKFVIDKGLFDFLGYGNSIGEAITAGITNNTELFAYAKVNVGFNLKKIRLSVQPAVFMPLVEIRESGGALTAINDLDGNMSVNAHMNMEVYTPFEVYFDNEGKVKINTDGLETSLFTGYGFDVAAELGFPITNTLSIEADARVPLIPGRIRKKYVVTSGVSFASKILDIGQNNVVNNQPQASTALEADLAINRPLKAHVYADKLFFGNMFDLRGGAGICLRRPFQEGALFYPEYYVGLTFNLWSIIKLNASTQYTDQLFIHQLGSTVNIRVVQLDLGASFQSADFKKSFTFSGFGAYAYVTVGF